MGDGEISGRVILLKSRLAGQGGRVLMFYTPMDKKIKSPAVHEGGGSCCSILQWTRRYSPLRCRRLAGTAGVMFLYTLMDRKIKSPSVHEKGSKGIGAFKFFLTPQK
ncbi:hypothetical protein ElyMa_006201000 [Elysia marginata]|uniref:Uncharacterized protein n=1 Tax=Elysia marginata TaxID=1093978 RepID=A0AAV4H6R3_9GAST|nr:hypothetical protein ElyMa_006201000 [Elysia marginata]